MLDALHSIVLEGYDVFAASKPKNDGVCSCCMDEKIKANLFAYGQKDMPLDYLNDWFFAASDSNMSKETWSYFLPMVLDVLAKKQDVSHAGNDRAFSRFPTGKRGNWDSAEWNVIDKFQRLYLSKCASVDFAEPIDDVICMFYFGGWDVDELFRQIFEWTDEKLVLRLWKDWCDQPNPFISISCFWPDGNVPLAYYTSDSLSDRLLGFALLEEGDRHLQDKALQVAEMILQSQM